LQDDRLFRAVCMYHADGEKHISLTYFYPLKPSGHYMYRTVVTICTTRFDITILRSSHTVYLCVLCGSQNKQRLFPCTTL